MYVEINFSIVVVFFADEKNINFPFNFSKSIRKSTETNRSSWILLLCVYQSSCKLFYMENRYKNYIKVKIMLTKIFFITQISLK